MDMRTFMLQVESLLRHDGRDGGAAAPAKPEAPTICSHCNVALSPEQKFCGGCGAPVILA